jgi:hypothetical protein
LVPFCPWFLPCTCIFFCQFLNSCSYSLINKNSWQLFWLGSLAQIRTDANWIDHLKLKIFNWTNSNRIWKRFRDSWIALCIVIWVNFRL